MLNTFEQFPKFFVQSTTWVWWFKLDELLGEFNFNFTKYWRQLEMHVIVRTAFIWVEMLLFVTCNCFELFYIHMFIDVFI